MDTADERLTDYYSKRYSLYDRAVIEKDPSAQRRVARLLKLKDPAVTELVQERNFTRTVLDRRWGKVESRQRRLSHQRRSRIRVRRPIGRTERRGSCNTHRRGSVRSAGIRSGQDPGDEGDQDSESPAGFRIPKRCIRQERSSLVPDPSEVAG